MPRLRRLTTESAASPWLAEIGREPAVVGRLGEADGRQLDDRIHDVHMGVARELFGADHRHRGGRFIALDRDARAGHRDGFDIGRRLLRGGRQQPEERGGAHGRQRAAKHQIASFHAFPLLLSDAGPLSAIRAKAVSHSGTIKSYYEREENIAVPIHMKQKNDVVPRASHRIVRDVSRCEISIWRGAASGGRSHWPAPWCKGRGARWHPGFDGSPRHGLPHPAPWHPMR